MGSGRRWLIRMFFEIGARFLVTHLLTHTFSRIMISWSFKKADKVLSLRWKFKRKNESRKSEDNQKTFCIKKFFKNAHLNRRWSDWTPISNLPTYLHYARLNNPFKKQKTIFHLNGNINPNSVRLNMLKLIRIDLFRSSTNKNT